ncbi:hypothetical protein [Chryseobacterium mulctrae]|nr:hypothetical protein [Chryseobacterium mulctrae]
MRLFFVLVPEFLLRNNTFIELNEFLNLFSAADFPGINKESLSRD